MEPRFTSRASSMQVRRPSPRHRTTTIQSGATGGRVSLLDFMKDSPATHGQPQVLNYISETCEEKRLSAPMEDICLTDEQIHAFQEAFELFDKNGGGTIDAYELQKTLADVGIYVNSEDLVDIMMSLDHDGNGEVDFEEFLHLMTNTDLFIAAISESETDEMRKRVILFDALTEFMKTQALKGAQEILGYYSKKYKKVVKKYGAVNKGAHVVGHYADGAKVIGLTDAELYKQLKLFNYVSDADQSNNSPYARNHHSELLRQIERDLKRREPIKPFGLGGPRKSSKTKSNKQPQRITLKVIGLERMSRDQGPSLFPRITLNDGVRERAASLAMKEKFLLPSNFSKIPALHRPGWTSQQMKMMNVDIRITEPGWTRVPIVEVNKLKKIIESASDCYFSNVSKEKLKSNMKFYRSLNTRKPPSMSLYNRVKEVMVDYSAATTNNQIGRVGPKKLQRAFVDDAKMSRALRQRSSIRLNKMTNKNKENVELDLPKERPKKRDSLMAL